MSFGATFETGDTANGARSGVLNDRPELGRIGVARSSGGGSSARFIHPGMTVLSTNGAIIGTVEAVEGQMIRLSGEAGSPCHLPINLVDGVDDGRVIVSAPGDESFGLGATP